MVSVQYSSMIRKLLQYALLCIMLLNPLTATAQTCFSATETTLIGIGGNIAQSAPSLISSENDIPPVVPVNIQTPMGAQPSFANLEAFANTFSTVTVFDPSGFPHELRIMYFKEPSGDILVGVYARSEDVDNPFTNGREGEPRLVAVDVSTNYLRMTFDGSGIRDNTTPLPDYDYNIAAISWTENVVAQALAINLNSVTAENAPSSVSNSSLHTNNGVPAAQSAPVFPPDGDVIPVVSGGASILKRISGNLDGSDAIVSSIPTVPGPSSPSNGTTWEDLEAVSSFEHRITVQDDRGYDHVLRLHFYRTGIRQFQVGLYVNTLDVLLDGGAAIGEIDYPREAGFISNLAFDGAGQRLGPFLQGTYDIELNIMWNTGASNSVLRFLFDPFSMLAGAEGICFQQVDLCPNDASKTSPGVCGCGIADVDGDNDGTPDCNDLCPSDLNKTVPGVCGCGAVDVDTDGDGFPDCFDSCPTGSLKTVAGVCGCNTPDTDTDLDGVPDCVDGCPANTEKKVPGICGCSVSDIDSDSDSIPDCVDLCGSSPIKNAPGICGCNVADTDSDADGLPDCVDQCPNDPGKFTVGACGCGVSDADSDGNNIIDCLEPPVGHVPAPATVIQVKKRRVTIFLEQFVAPVTYQITLRKRLNRKRIKSFTSEVTTRLARGRWKLNYKIINGRKKTVRSQQLLFTVR